VAVFAANKLLMSAGTKAADKIQQTKLNSGNYVFANGKLTKLNRGTNNLNYMRKTGDGFVAGRNIDKHLLTNALQLKSNGKFIVALHGNPTNVFIDDIALTPKQFANLLQSNGYKQGQSVLLVSCRTGRDASGFAQELSNILGEKVYAPQNKIGVDGSGRFYTVDDFGQYVTRPDGSIKDQLSEIFRGFMPWK
jgi:hypothetical protein